jgi:TfoX/Sxy family transcriptional regulator of competence genes
MAYDEELAERIRHAVDGEGSITEKKMFGGLAFLVHGNMAVAASGQGGLLLRVDPAESDELTRDERVDRMVMRGRAMDGWLRIDSEAVGTEADLQRWVDIGVAYARSLPTK